MPAPPASPAHSANSGQIQTGIQVGAAHRRSGDQQRAHRGLSARVNNAVNNSGMVEAIGGTLTMAGSLTNASGGTNASVGIIAAGSGAKVLVSSGLASNAGQIQLSGGTFDNNGAVLLPTRPPGSSAGYGTLRSGAIANDGRVLLSGGTSAVSRQPDDHERRQPDRALRQQQYRLLRRGGDQGRRGTARFAGFGGDLLREGEPTQRRDSSPAPAPRTTKPFSRSAIRRAWAPTLAT